MRIMHDGMLMPLFRLHYPGTGRGEPAGGAFGWAPLVFVGEASYCMYLLHFNLWNLIHGRIFSNGPA